jgi:hypothetical protein
MMCCMHSLCGMPLTHQAHARMHAHALLPSHTHTHTHTRHTRPHTATHAHTHVQGDVEATLDEAVAAEKWAARAREEPEYVI